MPHKFISTLKSLDGIIVLSKEQQRVLKEKYQIDSVFIPHGFNRPSYETVHMGLQNDKINIVVIGSNYRDFETLENIVEYCNVKCSNVLFHLLGQPAIIKEKFKKYSNAKFYERLNDNEYYSLISQCDYNFLPVKFATANNALLEAQFLGTTSILPAIDGINDYAAGAPDNIFYSSMEELKIICSSIGKQIKKQTIVDYAEKFLWSNVYKKLEKYYEQI